MTEYEKKKLEEMRTEESLRAMVREWFDRHPDARFCSAETSLAGYDRKIVGIEKMSDSVYLLKNYMGGNYDLMHWGISILARVVSAMPED